MRDLNCAIVDRCIIGAGIVNLLAQDTTSAVTFQGKPNRATIIEGDGALVGRIGVDEGRGRSSRPSGVLKRLDFILAIIVLRLDLFLRGEYRLRSCSDQEVVVWELRCRKAEEETGRSKTRDRLKRGILSGHGELFNFPEQSYPSCRHGDSLIVR